MQDLTMFKCITVSMFPFQAGVADKIDFVEGPALETLSMYLAYIIS